MQKLYLDDEVYYYANGKFYDSSWLEVNTQTRLKLGKQVFSNQDYSTFDPEQLMEYIKATKEAGLFVLARDACQLGADKYKTNASFMKRMLPIFTSAYRELKNPHMAIKVFETYADTNATVQSIALLTSVAAAYADIQDYDTATKFADMAYSRQGGSAGYRNELTLVYKRINSKSGGNPPQN